MKVTLVKTLRGRAICETTPRYDVLLNGKPTGHQIYYNMTGYTGTLPCPDGGSLSLVEGSMTQIRREVADLNRWYKSLANT